MVPPGPPSQSANNFCQSQNFNVTVFNLKNQLVKLLFKDASYCCSVPAVIFFDPDDMDECLEDLDNDEEPSSVEEFTLNRGVVGKGDVDFNSPGEET
jgi:hypothetical protein